MGGFPSGQRGQTVNLLQIASVVRIHLHPFANFHIVHQELRNDLDMGKKMVFTSQAGMVE